MNGKDGITFLQLRRIAEFFGRGVMFFLEPGPVIEAELRTAQFRTLANEKPEMSARLKGLIERVERHREIYLSLREDLDETDRASFSPPKLPTSDPERAALLIREWLALGDRNTFGSYRAAVESKDVLVFRSNGYSGKWQIAKDDSILGFTLYHPICPVIVVKKQPWESRQSFTLMHELGHLLLNKTSSIDDESDLDSHEGNEQLANAFAGFLLVPDRFLKGIPETGRPKSAENYDEWLREYRLRWGVSSEVILRRLLDAGRLSQRQYVAYREWRSLQTFPQKEGGSRKYRHREPLHVFGDTFVRTVFDALSARQVTLSKASRYLDNIKIKDLHQLEHHVAGL